MEHSWRFTDRNESEVYFSISLHQNEPHQCFRQLFTRIDANCPPLNCFSFLLYGEIGLCSCSCTIHMTGFGCVIELGGKSPAKNSGPARAWSDEGGFDLPVSSFWQNASVLKFRDKVKRNSPRRRESIGSVNKAVLDNVHRLKCRAQRIRDRDFNHSVFDYLMRHTIDCDLNPQLHIS